MGKSSKPTKMAPDRFKGSLASMALWTLDSAGAARDV
jgi:hypothetical protein